ncbi:M4 family metallopeptidase [Streptomyces sp. ODS28]|uniref:M4 family metallopeptidase n=1 Tax=Streptomyces sp. ODS28 TaxID=3136688 RepID=UPI0031ED4274
MTSNRSSGRTSGGRPTGRTRTATRAAGALAATAALALAGVTAGTANAGTAQPGPNPAPRQQALPAPLSGAERAALIKAASAPEATAADARALGLGAGEKLHVRDVVKNNDGATHIRYERTLDGLPVLGGDLVVHKSASGKHLGSTRATTAKLAVPSTLAPAAHKPDTPKAEGSSAPRKVVWAGGEGKPVLAWETVHGGTQKDGVTPKKLHVVTDAATGRELQRWQGVQEGIGNSQYSGKVKLGTSGSKGKFTLVDKGRGGNRTTNLKGAEDGQGTLFTDKDDVWGNGKVSSAQTAGVDAHYGAAVTWDYYKSVHGRTGIRGDGKGALSRVHFGKDYVNAFWDDSCFCMTYGDGEGNKKPLTSMDVAAHEMSHGVTSATANLIYEGESGGLNEATSDIFAAAVEFKTNNKKDVPDYLVGEKIDINGNGTPLRYMDKPSKDGESLDYWSKNAGKVDVHYSSGIANHFFYLLSEGSGKKTINGVKYNSPTADGKKVKGIGIKAAEKIWYKALTENMTSKTNYAAARKATVKAASDLFGKNSTQKKTVERAWTAVKVK